MDDKEIDELLVKAYKPIYTHLLFRTRNKEQASDLTHDSLLKIRQKLQEGKYTNNGSYVAWAVVIATRLHIDTIRKNKPDEKHFNHYYDILDEQPANEVSESLMIKIKNDISKFDPVTYNIIELRIWCDMKFNNIANILNMNTNTVQAKFYKAMRKLNEKYAKLLR